MARGLSFGRQPLFARNIVSTSHPLAAQVGLSLLQRGGNAVDAAIGAAAAMTVLEPCSNGLGSMPFAFCGTARNCTASMPPAARRRRGT